MLELIIFLLLAGALSAWWQLMQGRQKARQAAGRVCNNHDLQLLDDTVSLSSVTWKRRGKNSRIVMNYSFEFTTNGTLRRQGEAQISLSSTLLVTLDLEEGRLIEQLNQCSPTQ